MQHAKQFGALGGRPGADRRLGERGDGGRMVDEGARLFNAGVIVSNMDDGYQGKSVYTNPEIFFSPSIEMDNGITYGAWVELEGYTTGDQIDEHYLYAKGGFGKVTLGADDAAHYNLHSEARGGGFDNYNDPSYVATYGGMNTSDHSSSDSNGIIYMSPSFSGFGFRLIYKSDTAAAGGSILTSATIVGKAHRDYGDAVARDVKNSTTFYNFFGVSSGYQCLSTNSEVSISPDVTVACFKV